MKSSIKPPRSCSTRGSDIWPGTEIDKANHIADAIAHVQFWSALTGLQRGKNRTYKNRRLQQGATHAKQTRAGVTPWYRYS